MNLILKTILTAALCATALTATSAPKVEKLPPEEWVLPEIAIPGKTPFEGLQEKLTELYPDCTPSFDGDRLWVDGCFEEFPDVFYACIENLDGVVGAVIFAYSKTKKSYKNFTEAITRTYPQRVAAIRPGYKGKKAKWKTDYGEAWLFEPTYGYTARIELLSNGYLDKVKEAEEARENEITMQRILKGLPVDDKPAHYVPPEPEEKK